MQIVVNGQPRDVDTGTTVANLLSTLGATAGPVAVERNAQIVPRAEHATTELQTGDTLEIVHFVGGG